MGEQRVLADRQPEVLPAAASALEPAARQGVLEVGGTGQMAPDGPGMQDTYLADRAAGYVVVQALAHDLNFGEFGHASRLRIAFLAIGGPGRRVVRLSGRDAGADRHPGRLGGLLLGGLLGASLAAAQDGPADPDIRLE